MSKPKFWIEALITEPFRTTITGVVPGRTLNDAVKTFNEVYPTAYITRATEDGEV